MAGIMLFEEAMKSNPIIEKESESQENAYTILKTDEDKRLVFGWASVSIKLSGEQLEDRQKDMIDPEDLEEAAYEYVLNFRDTGEEHIASMRKKGKLVESCVLTEEKQEAMGIPAGTLPIGWWIGFKIEDDAAWERVKNGTYKMFSIEGRANRVPVEKAQTNYDEFPSYDMWLEENLDATIDEQRAADTYYRKQDAKQAESRNAVAKSFCEILNGDTARTIEKSDPDRFDHILEIHKNDFDHIVEIEKYNPYHDSRGRFAPRGGGGGRNYGSTGTADAAAQLKDEKRYTIGGKKNSLDGYLDENGNLTPEREAVHRQIIDDLLEGKVPVEGQATMTMLGGGPASGKSSVMNPDTSNDPHAVTVDPDMMKNLLPGYKELAEKDSRAADFFHEESSALAKRFADVAYTENYNVIYDGTGDGSPRSVQKKIDGARANGYRVEAKYVSIDTEEAVRRNQKRYDDAIARGETPRLPPVDMVVKTHTKCTDISVSMAAKFDKIEIWDNNGARGHQKLIATGGRGHGLKAVFGQDASFRRYLNKGAKGMDGFMTLPDGTVIPVE